MAIITIFSGSHCHGDEVARGVAEKLGYEPIGKKLLGETSRRFGIREDKLRRSLTGPAPFWNSFTREREKNIACLRAALADLIQEDGKLLHGYAGHLIPKGISHVLYACLAANFPYRVEQAAKTAGASEREAAKLVRAGDDERLQWTQYLFDKEPYDAGLYDLMVPMQETSVEDAVKLICDTATSDPVKTTELSRLAARDFQLAAQVNRSLAQAGHDVDVAAKHGEVIISLKRHVVRRKQYDEELARLAKETPGVSGVKVQLGPKCRTPGIRMQANVELPAKILLVDDEKEFVQTLSQRLKKRNLPSEVLYDGKSALELVKDDQPDVMVLDLMMPGIGGIEVLRDIKRTHPNIEVVILTGHGSEQEEKLAADLGAFAYLQKPVDIEVLSKTLREAYEKVNESKGGAADA